MMDEQEDTLSPALYDLQDTIETMTEAVRDMQLAVEAMKKVLELTVVA